MIPKLMPKVLYESLARGDYLDYQRIIDFPEGVLRVKFHSDSSYPIQSEAVVELWVPGQGWSRVHSPYPLSMKATWEFASKYTPDKAAAARLLIAAADELLAVALSILRGGK